MTTTKKVLYSTLFLSILFFSSNALAQDTTKVQSDPTLDAAIKVSGISPAVGVSYQVGNDSRLRALGFVSVNSFGTADSYLLDLSYLKNTDWITTENIDWYWGVNLHLQADGLIIGPGALVGTSYNIDDHFSIFGELNLNAFIIDDTNNVDVGMLNSGIGLRVSL